MIIADLNIEFQPQKYFSPLPQNKNKETSMTLPYFLGSVANLPLQEIVQEREDHLDFAFPRQLDCYR